MFSYVTVYYSLCVVLFKTQLNNNHLQRYKNEIIIRLTPRNTLPTSPAIPDSRSPMLLGRCSFQLRKSRAEANMVHSWADRVFVLEHYFPSKSSAADREALSNVYILTRKYRVRQYTNWQQCFRIQKCLFVTSAHRATKQLKLRPYRFQAAQ
jgi:hypothetical protein